MLCKYKTFISPAWNGKAFHCAKVHYSLFNRLNANALAKLFYKCWQTQNGSNEILNIYKYIHISRYEIKAKLQIYQIEFHAFFSGGGDKIGAVAVAAAAAASVNIFKYCECIPPHFGMWELEVNMNSCWTWHISAHTTHTHTCGATSKCLMYLDANKWWHMNLLHISIDLSRSNILGQKRNSD